MRGVLLIDPINVFILLFIIKSDTKVIKAILAGKCDVGIVNTYYLGREIQENNQLPVKVFWPNQNDALGVHVNISGAGILSNSKNVKESLKFIEWLALKEQQEDFANVNLEYPVNDQAKTSEIVKNWGEFNVNTDFNLMKTGILQSAAIKLMNEVNYR